MYRIEKVTDKEIGSKNGRLYREKRTRCIFCHADVGHFYRHLIRWHGDEKEVKAFSSLPKENKTRALLIGILRKRGNFMKMSENIICPVRRPRKENLGESLCYKACIFCQGLYRQEYIRRHQNRCPLNKGRRNCDTKKTENA